MTSEEILTELLSSKKWILAMLPGTNIILSCPTIRNDNQKTRLTILRLRHKLVDLNIDIITNKNINDDH